MAKLRTLYPFHGTLQGMSAFTRRDLPGVVILRTPAGPSRHDIRTRPSFDLTRRNGQEFGGRSTAAKWIRRALQPLRGQEDHNVMAALIALLKPVQERDGASAFGQRHVCLSQAPHLLAGFNLNRKYPFEGVVRSPLDYTLSKETLTARLQVPELLPGVNFFAPTGAPWFRVTALLGVVPDLFFARPRYKAAGDYSSLFSTVVHTEWFPVKGGAPATVLDLQLPYTPPDAQFSLLLAAGIQMGTAGATGSMEGVRYTGSGKVVEVE